MQNIEMLEKEVATLQARETEIAAEFSRAVTKRDAAQEELIQGNGTLTNLTQSENAVHALERARAEIDRRAAAKKKEIASAKADADRAQRIAEMEAAGVEYDTMRAAIMDAAGEIAAVFSDKIPALLDSMKALHGLQLKVTNLAREIEGQEPPATVEYQVIARQIIEIASDLMAQRSFAAAIDSRREWNNQLELSRQHERENALGLHDRTHQGEPVARIAETNVVSNAEAITRILEGKATLTRF